MFFSILLLSKSSLFCLENTVCYNFTISIKGEEKVVSVYLLNGVISVRMAHVRKTTVCHKQDKKKNFKA